jgi:hypothetical protein
MVIRTFYRFLVWSWWVMVPHPWTGPGTCPRCQFPHMRKWY